MMTKRHEQPVADGRLNVNNADALERSQRVHDVASLGVSLCRGHVPWSSVSDGGTHDSPLSLRLLPCPLTWEADTMHVHDEVTAPTGDCVARLQSAPIPCELELSHLRELPSHRSPSYARQRLRRVHAPEPHLSAATCARAPTERSLQIVTRLLGRFRACRFGTARARGGGAGWRPQIFPVGALSRLGGRGLGDSRAVVSAATRARGGEREPPGRGCPGEPVGPDRAPAVRERVPPAGPRRGRGPAAGCGQTARTCAACRPLGPCWTVYSTFWSSSSVR
jgi:hypothetical protein